VIHRDVEELDASRKGLQQNLRKASNSEEPIDTDLLATCVSDPTIIVVNKTNQGILNWLDHVVRVDPNSLSLVIVSHDNVKLGFKGRSFSPDPGR
jgi:hypothetical protein